MYLTYEEYQNMGGTLDEATFNDYQFEAESVINWYTFNRLQNDTEFPQVVKQLMYHLISMIQKRASVMGTDSAENSTVEGGKEIASQSNDGVSISYNIMSAADTAKLLKDEMGEEVKRYLQGVVNSLGQKVLYRGLYPGE